MSQPRGFGLNGKSIYANIGKLCEVYLSFSVLSTNGLGVTSVKSNGYVSNVSMHTSTTPAANNGITNPNPANGVVMIQLANNFNYLLSSSLEYVVSPVTGAALTSVTAGTAYQIVSLGTATAAQWAAKGLVGGFTAAVGMSFVASASGTIGGSATVKALGVSNIGSIELLGNPQLMLNNSNISVNNGAQVMFQFLSPTNASTTTPVATAPADGTVVGIKLVFDGSSVTVDGL